MKTWVCVICGVERKKLGVNRISRFSGRLGIEKEGERDGVRVAKGTMFKNKYMLKRYMYS